MTKSKKSFLTFLVLTCAYMNLVGTAQEASSDIQTNRAKFKEMYDRLQPVHIYGKVVDQNGHAVEGADVKVGWERATIFIGIADNGSDTWAKSDANGMWQLVIEKPLRAYVEDVKKPYYEYSTSYNQDSMSRNLVERKTAPNAPVETVIRKKGEETFLIVNPGGGRGADKLIWTVSNRSDNASLDLLAKVGEKKTPQNRRYADLQAQVSYDLTGRCWTVVYRATNGTDGIVCSDKLLYEAPEAGYEKEVVLPGRPHEEKYLYLRSRSPTIYSRVLVKHDAWQELQAGECFRILCQAWINPYGERTLEYDGSMEENWRVKDELTEEAKTEIEARRLPPKPDIPKRIKAMNEKIEKEKAEQEKRKSTPSQKPK